MLIHRRDVYSGGVMAQLVLPICNYSTRIVVVYDEKEQKLDLEYQKNIFYVDTILDALDELNSKPINSEQILDHKILPTTIWQWVAHSHQPLFYELLDNNRFNDVSILMIPKVYKQNAEHYLDNLRSRSLKIFYYDNNNIDNISDSIELLKKQYFLDMSYRILKILNISNLPYLENVEYAKNFLALCSQFDICEYYLANNFLDWLALDYYGSLYKIYNLPDPKIEALNQKWVKNLQSFLQDHEISKKSLTI